LTFDLDIYFIFAPNCTKDVNMVKCPQAVSKISCSQTFRIWLITDACTESLKTKCLQHCSRHN